MSAASAVVSRDCQRIDHPWGWASGGAWREATRAPLRARSALLTIPLAPAAWSLGDPLPTAATMRVQYDTTITAWSIHATRP
jgi:hypothetical protein